MNSQFSILTNLFTKMCGTGNDFLITDETRIPSVISIDNLIQRVPELCHPKFGLGTDGLCILTSTPHGVWNWQFFNKDGSTADMCGNAACCIIQYAFNKKLTTNNAFTFQMKDKILTGIVHSNGKVQLTTNIPQFIEKNVMIVTEDNRKLQINRIHSGVEHIVINSSNVLHLEKLRPLAQTLRKKYLNANITFYQSQNNQTQCVTFERGVEDFTLACGTGALAAAYQLSSSKNNLFTVKMPGGDLKIQFDQKHAYLTSAVHFVAEISPIIYK